MLAEHDTAEELTVSDRPVIFVSGGVMANKMILASPSVRTTPESPRTQDCNLGEVKN